MIDPNCPVCFGIGWVCENHPMRVWDEKLGCQCGIGMPCECQRANGFEQPDVSKIMTEANAGPAGAAPRSESRKQ
jgi:hypothetical protein